MTTATLTMEPGEGIVLLDDDGEHIDPGCPAHSDHWLAAACRGNRRALGMEPQECEDRPECAAALAADDAHHDTIRADIEAARARLAAREARP